MDYSATQNHLLVLPVTSQINAEKHRFMGVDGNYTGAGKKALGVTNRNVNAGAEVGVEVLGRLTVRVGADITVTDEPVPVTSDAEGKAVPLTDPAAQKLNGYALYSALSDELVSIMRGI